MVQNAFSSTRHALKELYHIKYRFPHFATITLNRRRLQRFVEKNKKDALATNNKMKAEASLKLRRLLKRTDEVRAKKNLLYTESYKEDDCLEDDPVLKERIKRKRTNTKTKLIND